MFEKSVFDEKNFMRRRGRFTINEMDLKLAPYETYLALSEVMVTDCVYNWNEQKFDYWAISPHFSKVKEGQMVPRYRAIVNCIHDDSKDTVEYRVQFDREE